MRLTYLGILALIGCAATLAKAQQTPSQDTSITLAAGTKVELAVIAPVWMKDAKAGDPIYMQTTFPVLAGSGLAIPAGSYVQGSVLSVTKPTRRSDKAEIDVLFERIVFAADYAAALPTPGSDTPGSIAPAPTAAKLNVQVSWTNDLLLDNGAQLEMTLGAPLTLNAARVAASVPLTRPVKPGDLHTATRCAPTPGTPGSPGTSDTVIPGSPGTPDTVIPGGPGMPDTVIPGTPSTPSTVIPGSPGTPGTAGTVCPAPPMVIASTPFTPMAPPTPTH